MKYRIGSCELEAIGTIVRVTVNNIGGPDAPPVTRTSRRECPSATDVADMLADIRGYYPDAAHLQVCGRVADDARAERDACAVLLD